MELVVSGTGIGLEDAFPALQVPGRVLAGPVGGESEDDGRRRGAVERSVVANTGPEPRSFGTAPREERHRRIIAMQAGSGQDMGLDQRVERLRQFGHGAHLVGRRGQAGIHALPGMTVGLTVERLVPAELFEDDHRQQARSGPAAGGRAEGCRSLADLLAVPTGELLACHCRGLLHLQTLHWRV